MLAVLLDAGVAEADAVMLAAQSTDNGIFIRRAERVFERLGYGVPLMTAVQALDDTGEFRWRLENAAHGHGGFLTALNGWHDALDAKAYQQEQAVSQLFTTGIVVLNGCLVAVILTGVFQVLTTIVQELSLW
jgi:type II secretory pathway component PulF